MRCANPIKSNKLISNIKVNFLKSNLGKTEGAPKDDVENDKRVISVDKESVNCKRTDADRNSDKKFYNKGYLCVKNHQKSL